MDHRIVKRIQPNRVKKSSAYGNVIKPTKVAPYGEQAKLETTPTSEVELTPEFIEAADIETVTPINTPVPTPTKVNRTGKRKPGRPIDPMSEKYQRSNIEAKKKREAELMNELRALAAQHGDDEDRANLKERFGNGSRPSFMRKISDQPTDGCAEASVPDQQVYSQEIEDWADNALSKDGQWDRNYRSHKGIKDDECRLCGLKGLDLQQFQCDMSKLFGKPTNPKSVVRTGNTLHSVAGSENGTVKVTSVSAPIVTHIPPQGVVKNNPPIRVASPRQKQSEVTKPVATSPVQFLKVPVKGGTGSHIVVNALAGTGKTFTVVEGTNRMLGCATEGIVGSDEQEAIWEAMGSSNGHSVHLMAFNRSIADELVKRIPSGATASTSHSFGLKAIKRSGMSAKVEKRKTNFILTDGFEENHFQKYPGLCNLCESVVALIKANLLDWTFQEWSVEQTVGWLMGKYDIEASEENFSLLVEVLPYLMSEHYHRTHIIDMEDMIWFPNVHPEIRMDKYDTLIVDEAQDLNKAQQGLVMLSGRRVVLVGDRNQAIYAFTGADEAALDNMKVRLGETAIGCQEFPLFETRRCCNAVTSLAKEIVPDFRNLDTLPEGKVIYNKEEDGYDHIGPNDLVVCRTNAPIISLCLKFLRDGKRARIQGKDMVEDLKRLIKRTAGDAEDTATMLDNLDEYYNTEANKISKRRFGSEAALMNLSDRVDSVKAFAIGTLTVAAVIAKIDDLFDDKKHKDGTLFSSIHRAKGLEAETVVFLQEDNCPHPMARTPEARKQEMNLRYVAITRAKTTLYMTKARQKQQLEREEL